MCDCLIFSVQYTYMYSDMSHNDEAPDYYVYVLLNLEFLQLKLDLFWNNLQMSKFHPTTTTL